MSELRQDVFLRKLHRNEKGSWTEAEKLAKEQDIDAAVIDGLASDLMKVLVRMQDRARRMWEIAPAKDCFLHESPLAPAKISHYLKMYLKKLGFDGIRDVLDPSVSIPEFSKQAKDGTKWLLKFKNEK